MGEVRKRSERGGVERPRQVRKWERRFSNRAPKEVARHASRLPQPPTLSRFGDSPTSPFKGEVDSPTPSSPLMGEVRKRSERGGGERPRQVRKWERRFSNRAPKVVARQAALLPQPPTLSRFGDSPTSPFKGEVDSPTPSSPLTGEVRKRSERGGVERPRQVRKWERRFSNRAPKEVALPGRPPPATAHPLPVRGLTDLSLQGRG